MSKRIAWMGASCLALAVLAAGPLVFKGTVEEWNDGLVDQVTFVQEGPWGGWYDALEVGALDNSKAAMEGNEKGVAAAKAVAAQQDALCREALTEGYTAAKPRIVDRGQSAPAGARVAVLAWQCTEISPGSRAKRFWISFGAGQSGVALTGTLKDKATGQELLRFSHRRSSGFNVVTGGDYERLLKIDSGDVARDVGTMLGVVLRTPGKPAPQPPAPPAAVEPPAEPAAPAPPEAVEPPAEPEPPPPVEPPAEPAG